MDSYTITKIELWPADIPLTDPFVVATGERRTAENAFVRLTLGSGVQGYGEMAPFPEVGGEDRASCLTTAEGLARHALGRPAVQYRDLARQFHELAPSHPAARCGLETALVDAVARKLRVPLWVLWGGADVRVRETDITLPIASVERTLELGRRWYERGFRLFKIKVGTTEGLGRGDAMLDEDIRRVEALHRAFPNIAFIVDANQGFSRDDCLLFAKAVQRMGGTIRLLEQPVPREDLDGLAALRRDTGLAVAADESARTVEDVHRLAARRAVDLINIKIMKSGLIDALDIAAYARTSGLGLMIGGMVESRVAMGCSFSLALGSGGYEVLDLDTPLLMAADPARGGYRYDGPRLLPWMDHGLDVEMTPAESLTIVE